MQCSVSLYFTPAQVIPVHVRPEPGRELPALRIMGEYVLYKGERIKVGTCESMYYLRAEQVPMVMAIKGNLDPVRDCASIRFRFPFPAEDGTEPGRFHPFDYGLGVSGIEVPEVIEHDDAIQFVRTYPRSGGVLASLPCPEGKAGKATGLRFSYNGYAGKVLITQQRVYMGKLALVCECGSCGVAYCLPVLEEAQPVIEALRDMAEREDNTPPGDKRRGDYYRKIVSRIIEGYECPPDWVRGTFAPSLLAGGAA